MRETKQLSDFIEGDTFESLSIEILENGTALDLTGFSILGTFRKNDENGTVVKTAEVGTGFTLTDPTNGIFQIDQFDINWNACLTVVDIKFTNATSKINTYLRLKFNVLESTNG